MRARHLTYIDTSVWCAYAFNEPEAPHAVAWLAQAELDRVATAWWTVTEFASAVGVNRRDKQGRKGMTADKLARASQAFDAAIAMAVTLEVHAEDFLQAAEWCAQPKAKLRGGDALHLAVAQRHGCKALASLDDDMNMAAQALGFELVSFD